MIFQHVWWRIYLKYVLVGNKHPFHPAYLIPWLSYEPGDVGSRDTGRHYIEIVFLEYCGYSNGRVNKWLRRVLHSRGPFHWYGLTLFPAWISNYIHHNVWVEITYPFPNFNGYTVEVWEWISNFIPLLYWACNYLSTQAISEWLHPWFTALIHRWVKTEPQRPVTWSFDVFFDLRLNKELSKQWNRWWCETPSHSLWHHCNG